MTGYFLFPCGPSVFVCFSPLGKLLGAPSVLSFMITSPGLSHFTLMALGMWQALSIWRHYSLTPEICVYYFFDNFLSSILSAFFLWDS